MLIRAGAKATGAIAFVAVLLIGTLPASATLLVADFNDLVAGAINGKAGGTGFSSTWSGSSGGNVVAGNLTSSLYAAAQVGTAQKFRNANNTGLRQNYRTVATSPAGTIWFSFLAMAEAAGDRAGLSINAPTLSPFDNPGTVYAYLEGSTLNYRFGSGPAGSVANAAAIGTTALIVGRMNIIGGSGVDSISLWVNPDLIANPDINTYTPVYTSSTVNFLDSIAHIGAIAARANSASIGGGNVDNIRFSDGGGNPDQAYLDVTGVPVPEPTSILLLIIGAAAGAACRFRPLRSAV